VKSVALRAV